VRNLENIPLKIQAMERGLFAEIFAIHSLSTGQNALTEQGNQPLDMAAGFSDLSQSTGY
jgi:hypothetical protein